MNVCIIITLFVDAILICGATIDDLQSSLNSLLECFEKIMRVNIAETVV